MLFREKLLKYTEFAAEFGSSEALRPASFDMNFIEYYNLDLLAIFLFFATLLSIINFKVLQYFCTRYIRKAPEKEKKTESTF